MSTPFDPSTPTDTFPGNANDTTIGGGGSPSPINGSPLPFTVGPAPGTVTQVVTFPIPAGVYTSASMFVSGTNISGSGIGGTLSSGGGGVTFTGHGASGLPQPFTDTEPCPAGMLADINAAAGGNYTATYVVATGSQNTINSLVLTLVGSGGGGSSVVVPSRPTAIPSLYDAQNTAGGNAPVSAKFTVGDTTTVPPSLNNNALSNDLLAYYSAGFGVAAGLALSPPVGSGLNLTVKRGQALILGVVELFADTLVTLLDNKPEVYVWLRQDRTLTVEYTNAVVDDACYLGRCSTSSGVIGNVSYAGVVFIRGGNLYRKTADTKTPVDSPPANEMIFTSTTKGGLYLWDGERHWGIAGSNGNRTRVVVNAKFVTVAATGTNYRIGLNFAGSGLFDDIGYAAVMTCDEDGVVIEENTARKTVGFCEWTVYVPSDASAGLYNGVKDLKLTVELFGYGWSGLSTLISGVWSALRQVL